MTIFDDLATAVANAGGMDTTSAGLLLGFSVIAVGIIALIIATRGDEHTGPFAMLLSGVGMAFSVLVGWWPAWTVIFIALIIAFLVFRPFGGNGGMG